MSLSLRPNTNTNNGLAPGVRDMEVSQSEDSTSILVSVGLSDEQDTSCQNMRRTQVLEPVDSSSENDTPSIMGKLWYTPDCEDCCHPPKPAISLLQITTVLVEDEQTVKGLKTALTQGTPEQIENQLENTFAYMQDNISSVYIKKEDVNSLISRGPKNVRVSEKTRLDFEAKFDFQIPKKVSNLMSISFLSIDRERALQSYGLELSLRESV